MVGSVSPSNNVDYLLVWQSWLAMIRRSIAVVQSQVSAECNGRMFHCIPVSSFIVSGLSKLIANIITITILFQAAKQHLVFDRLMIQGRIQLPNLTYAPSDYWKIPIYFLHLKCRGGGGGGGGFLHFMNLPDNHVLTSTLVGILHIII